jgi:hypothetical protein
LAALPARPWCAYPAVALVQGRALWGVWHNDLTPGDGSRYFQDSVLWTDHGKVNLAWSPLYDVFYGTTRKLLGGDALAGENLHRALIALGVTLLLLALARRLLPPGPALLVALWWAVLPVNYDALYEVHLFAPAFPLAAALLLSDDPGPWRRGSAFALLVLAMLLVRNEFVFVAVLVAAGLVYATRGRRRPVAAALVPLLVVALVAGGLYSRGVEKDGALRDSLEGRQKTAMCQHFALNYEQRHPEVRLNPFLQCRVLMQQTFGEEHPTFAAAWWENPRAMAAFTAWHGRLVPNGLQLGLFYGVGDHANPDFAPAQLGRAYAWVLSLLLLALLAFGVRALWLDRGAWLPDLRRQRLAWLAVGATALGALIVGTFFVRPRPSFIFGLTIALMLVAGLALAALLRRYRLERAGGLAAVMAPLLVLALLPVHFKDEGTPLADAYHRLRPLSDRVASGEPLAMSRVAFGDDVCFYVAPNRPCSALDYATAIAPQAAKVGLERALARAQVEVLYADPALAAAPPVAGFIAHPPDGWRIARSGRDEGRPWAVLVRG